MKSSLFFISALFVSSSEAFVLPTTSSSATTSQLSAQTRAEFLRDVATTSIASVIVSLPGVATADDTDDLAMPTAEEQKAADVSKAIIYAAAINISIKTTLTLDATSLFGIEFPFPKSLS